MIRPLIAALALLSAPALADPRTGLYHDPDQPGRGFAIEVNEAGRFFMAVYDFDIGQLKPTFTLAMGGISGNVAAAPLFEVRHGQQLGGACREARVWNSEPIGDVSMVFKADGRATVTWPGGVTPLARIDGAATGGVWYDPACPGIGYFLETHGQTMTMLALIYEPDGAPGWRTATLGMIAPGAFAGDLMHCESGQRPYADEPYRAPKCKANGAVMVQVDGYRVLLTIAGVRVELERFRF